MTITLPEGYVPVDALLVQLDGTVNLMDMHLICYQAGCPVYLVRDKAGFCGMFWHPKEADEQDAIRMSITAGTFRLMYNDGELPFGSLESMRESFLIKHMLGENPFESKYLVWSSKA